MKTTKAILTNIYIFIFFNKELVMIHGNFEVLLLFFAEMIGIESKLLM
jgi:hypothetical protein